MRRQYLKDRVKGKQRGLDNECYCKKQEIADKFQHFHPSATSIIDHSSLHSSQSRKLLETMEEVENTNEKMMDRRSTTINFDIESSDKQRFKTNNLESQILSPDMQNAIENAEKILEEVQHKIAEATLLSSKTETKRRIKKKEWYPDDLQLEPPLEDEKDEALYIRELVLSKLKEIDQEDSESNAERNQMLTTKIREKRNRRISRLLEPKFANVRRRFGDISYQHKNYYYVPNEQIKSHHPKDKISNEVKKDDPVENINRQKIKSLTIQKGPTLSIERKLKKQNIGFVNISPDASFVQSDSNINIYEFRHISCVNNKSLKDKVIDRSKMGETIDEIDEISARLINSMENVTKDTKEDDNGPDTKEYQSIWKNDDGKDLIDERKNDLSFENETNNDRREVNRDRETVSKHLPKTGVNDHFLSNTELNCSFNSDLIKNLTSEQKHLSIENVHSDVDTNMNKLLIENDIKDTSKSLNDDNENVDNYKKETTGNIQEIRGDDIKLLKKKKTIDYEKSLKMINKDDIVKNRERKIHESFDNICQKYNLRNISLYKSIHDSTVSSNNSLKESDNSSFNELELNAPSIDNFDDIFVHYDQMIERISKGEKKLEKMLEEFQMKLSTQSDKNKLSDNIEVTSCGIVALKSDDCKLIKLNPSKFRYKYKKDEESTLSLSDDAMIVLPKRDKLQINSCITNNRSSLTNPFRNLKRRETSKALTYPLEQKQNDLLIDTILTLNKSNLSSVDLNAENISDENKTLEMFSNHDKVTACVPLSTNHRSNCSNDPEDLIKDDESNRTLFNNEEIILSRISKFLLERQDQFVDCSSSEERKINFERLIVQDLMKHLQMFSNKYDHDIPTISQKFITDLTNHRESNLFLNFLSIQKHDYENENKFSSKTIVRDNECKMQIDDISNTNCFDDTECIPIQPQDKSIAIHPLNSMEIEDIKDSINKIKQKEIQVLEKNTQYDISFEQNTLEYENQIIEDICTNKENEEQMSETKSEIEECSLKLNKENYSNSTKIDLIINDDTYKRDKSSEINTMTSDLHLPVKIINKLSEGEDSGNTSNANIENIPDTNFATTSSETSHSEGELYLPSSCSYSLGEVRIMKNSASVCNRALVNNSTLTCVYDTTSLLHYSSGEVQHADSTDTL